MSEQINDLISRGVAEIIDKAHLESRLNSGRPLLVKLGIDPNKPNLHIGHAVPLRKLREFQDAGHKAVIIIGDYTAQLGDPSDRSEARKLISASETKANAKLVLEQIFRILIKNKTIVRYNSEWFDQFDLRAVIELMSHTTVNQLIAHETFQKRLRDELPLFSQEILYPMMQGYDSVMVNADVELGGLDQKFNVLMGRVMQRAYGKKEQEVMLFPYLPGTDGQAKMSKSLGNTINLTDSAHEMYGKTMSIPDQSILEYYKLATLVPSSAIELIEKELISGSNPRDLKMQLAREIVTLYHGPNLAKRAEEQFIAQFQKGQVPEAIAEKKLARSYKTVILMLIDSGLVASNSEARRMVEQGAVKLDGKSLDDPLRPVKLAKGMVIQVGKRRFVKVK